MPSDLSTSLHLIVPLGTQVVLRADNGAHPAGSVAEIVACPTDATHAYRVRFPDASETSITRTAFSILKQLKKGPLSNPLAPQPEGDLTRFIIYRCVVGSQAYGLNRDSSDIDRRGIYLPPADLQWSLYGVPEQIENAEAEECYWELQKFLSLALKANPNILECLFTPIVEYTTEIADAVLARREIFLSKIVFQTYNGYVMSQFKKLEQDLRANGEIKWKHAMHLIRLLLQGISVLQDGYVPVDVTEHRSDLLAIRDGDRPWSEVNIWRLELHRQFEAAFQTSALPDVPDYEETNRLLLWARRKMVEVQPVKFPAQVHIAAQEHPYPLLFATVSGAHLYGFASADSDWDLRGAHILPAQQVVGLVPLEDTIEVARNDEIELDLVTHDIRKFFSLLLRPNGYVLEQLLSPLIVYSTPEHDEVKQLVPLLLTKHHAHHYVGFANNQWELFSKEQPPRIKPLLYTFRVLLTGIYLMQEHKVEANLENLNEIYRLPFLPDLIARKKGGAEKETLATDELKPFEREFLSLRERLVGEASRTLCLKRTLRDQHSTIY